MAATGTHIPHWGGNAWCHPTACTCGSQQRCPEQSRWLVWHSLQRILQIELGDAPRVKHGSHRYGWTDVPGTLKCLCMKQLHPVHNLQKFSINIHGLFGLPGNFLWWVSNCISEDIFLIIFHEVRSGRQIWLVLSLEKPIHTLSPFWTESHTLG